MKIQLDQAGEARRRPGSILSTWLSGFVFSLIFLCGPAFGSNDQVESSSEADRQDSTGRPQQTPDSETSQEGTKQSPVLGKGVRTPPDVGAGGTATPTPPVRSESPTGEPEILPPGSPGLPQPSDSTSAPLDEDIVPSSESDEPLGQPDLSNQ